MSRVHTLLCAHPSRVHTRICILHTHAHTFTSTYPSRVRICLYMYVPAHVCAQPHIYTHIHMCKHTLTCAHTPHVYTHMCTPFTGGWVIKLKFKVTQHTCGSLVRSCRRPSLTPPAPSTRGPRGRPLPEEPAPEARLPRDPRCLGSGSRPSPSVFRPNPGPWAPRERGKGARPSTCLALEGWLGPLWAGAGEGADSLGTRLMALRGLRTRTVRMADRLMFCRSSEYSTILRREGRVRAAQEARQGHGPDHRDTWPPMPAHVCPRLPGKGVPSPLGGPELSLL